MKSIILGACFAMVIATPAMAFELYHCAVGNGTDSYFNTIDLKVDGQSITGSTDINGSSVDIGGNSDVFANQYPGDDGRPMIALIYQPDRDTMESLGFNLQDVTGKLGKAHRVSSAEGFGSTETQVDMTCDMATPI